MKLSGISMFRPAFKGVEYRKDKFGDTCYYFNYPHDTSDAECTLEIARLSPDEGSIVGDPIRLKLPDNGSGVVVNFKEYDIKPTDKIAYRYVIKHKDSNESLYAKDPGMNFGTDYSKLSLSTLKPTVNGSGYLLMPDSFAPGYVFKGFNEISTGENGQIISDETKLKERADEIGQVVLDKELRANAEKSPRTFSNSYGGGLAGMIEKVPYLHDRGIKVVFGTPITGGDTVSAFKYWPENLFQLAGGIGEMNNYEDYISELYKNGMIFVMDAPLTSEGYGGIHHQYALKWGDRDNQMRHWFRMENIDNDQIGYGIVGKNSEGLRHYLVNAPHKFTKKDGEIHYEVNENFDPSKPTYIQYYDKDYVSPELVAKQQVLDRFDKMTTVNPLQTATHDDTVVNFNHILTKADYRSYLKNIDTLNEINKNGKVKMDIDSKDGTVFVSNLTTSKLSEKKATGELVWDANTDMIKLRYFESAYDYVSNYNVPVDEKGMTAANVEIQDMMLKFAKYWSQKDKDVREIYNAQVLGNIGDANTAKSVIDNLIKDNKLPVSGNLDMEALQMIDMGLYNLKLPEITADTLITSLVMDIPLESLTLSKDTLGVLSTSYFTARANRSEQLGMTRYQLAQEGNPQFTEYQNQHYGYKDVYEKVNDMFAGEVYDFTRGVLERVDAKMPADKKIFADKSKNILTEYGYYVTKYVAEDAARYILTKALVPDAKAVYNSKGQIIYDYNQLREESSLPQLGVVGHTPKYEAELLAKRLKKGLRNQSTNTNNLEFVKDAVIQRFGNVSLNAFRYSEAMVAKSGTSMRYRIDALKDIADIDSAENQNEDKSKILDQLQNFWRAYKDTIASVAPDACIYDEITDTSKFIPGEYATTVGFIDKSEHTSEAAYNYFFTDFMKMFTGESAKAYIKHNYFGGEMFDDDAGRQSAINNQLRNLLLKAYPVDYFRNLYTFGGNHDKPRLAYCMMVDQKQVHADINNLEDSNPHRVTALLMITGALDMDDMPFDYLYHRNDRAYINDNYLMGASNTAIANGSIIRNNLDKVLVKNNVITEKEASKLHDAVTALVNGNYTMEPEKRASFVDYKTAFAEILDMAEAKGLRLNINADERLQLIDRIQSVAKKTGKNNKENIYGYTPYYKDTDVPNQILVLCNLLRDAVGIVMANNNDTINKLDAAIREYMHKYTQQDITEDLKQHLSYNLNRKDNERNAFGGQDIREAIRLVFAKAGMEGKTDAQFKLFKALNDPAVAKVKMYMRILASLPGVPTLYGGDEFGMGGAEKKSKNIDLKNRNALPFSKLEGDDEEAKYYKQLNDEFKAISLLRDNDNLSPLNDGTPYYLTMQYADNGVKLPTAFSMDGDGSAVLSLFNLSGIYSNREHDKDYETRVQQPNQVELDRIRLESDKAILGIGGLSLTAGLVFRNIVEGDNTIYKVVKEGTDYFIRRFDAAGNVAKKIVLNGGTMMDGVFTLFHKVHFKGGNRKEYYNPQFNIVSNPYHYLNENVKCGEKLSVIAK